MKKVASVIVVAGLVGTPAFAAGPAPVYSWTGFYVGGNIGVSFGRAKTDFNVDSATHNIPSLFIPGFGGSAITEPSGVIGGGQIGYNWQFSPIWVVGVEADIQGSDERDGLTILNPFIARRITTDLAPAAPVTGTSVINYETKIDWFGTVRARAGYLFGDGAVLAYVTGGLAYGRVGVDGTGTTSVSSGVTPFSFTHTLGHSQVNTGWTVGTGTEGKLLIPGWTYKIESLYVALGSLDDNDLPPITTTGGRIHTHTSLLTTSCAPG